MQPGAWFRRLECIVMQQACARSTLCFLVAAGKIQPCSQVSQCMAHHHQQHLLSGCTRTTSGMCSQRSELLCKSGSTVAAGCPTAVHMKMTVDILQPAALLACSWTGNVSAWQLQHARVPTRPICKHCMHASSRVLSCVRHPRETVGSHGRPWRPHHAHGSSSGSSHGSLGSLSKT